jgi:hypothetical protein
MTKYICDHAGRKKCRGKECTLFTRHTHDFEGDWTGECRSADRLTLLYARVRCVPVKGGTR